MKRILTILLLSFISVGASAQSYKKSMEMGAAAYSSGNTAAAVNYYKNAIEKAKVASYAIYPAYELKKIYFEQAMYQDLNSLFLEYKIYDKYEKAYVLLKLKQYEEALNLFPFNENSDVDERIYIAAIRSYAGMQQDNEVFKKNFYSHEYHFASVGSIIFFNDDRYRIAEAYYVNKLKYYPDPLMGSTANILFDALLRLPENESRKQELEKYKNQCMILELQEHRRHDLSRGNDILKEYYDNTRGGYRDMILGSPTSPLGYFASADFDLYDEEESMMYYYPDFNTLGARFQQSKFWYSVIDNFNKALRFNIVSKYPSVDIYKSICKALYYANRHAEFYIKDQIADAIDGLSEYIENNPNDIEAYFVRARTTELYSPDNNDDSDSDIFEIMFGGIYQIKSMSSYNIISRNLSDYNKVIDAGYKNAKVIDQCLRGIDRMDAKMASLRKSEDNDKKIAGLELDARRGDVNAMVSLSYYLSGQDGFSANSERAFYWAEMASERGNKVGQFNLGLFYEQGKGCPKNITKAIYWIKKSAEQGYDNARKHLVTLEENYHQTDKLMPISSDGFNQVIVDFKANKLTRPSIIYVSVKGETEKEILRDGLNKYAALYPNNQYLSYTLRSNYSSHNNDKEKAYEPLVKMDIRTMPYILILLNNGVSKGIPDDMTFEQLERILNSTLKR